MTNIDLINKAEPPLAPTSLSPSQTSNEALQRDPIALARSLVQFCRASGIRRHTFSEIIDDGNKNGDFATNWNAGFQLPNLQLLHDMEVRWDSTYHMIHHIMEMEQVRSTFGSMCCNQCLITKSSRSSLVLNWSPHLRALRSIYWTNSNGHG